VLEHLAHPCNHVSIFLSIPRQPLHALTHARTHGGGGSEEIENEDESERTSEDKSCRYCRYTREQETLGVRVRVSVRVRAAGFAGIPGSKKA
jgi:hypothetical protein